MSFPCPCCGSMAFPEPPGSNETCAVCGWEDDPLQLRFPLMPAGANRSSLFAAQRAFIVSRKIAKDRDPFWRPLDRRRDVVEPLNDDPDVDLSLTGPKRTDELYYWTANFWLRRDPRRYLNGLFCPLPRQSFHDGNVDAARKTLIDALRVTARDGNAARGLLMHDGKALLHLAAFRQGDLFSLDPRQQTFLQALWYAITDREEDAGLVGALAAAVLAEEG